jgi:hypothetical protein
MFGRSGDVYVLHITSLLKFYVDSRIWVRIHGDGFLVYEDEDGYGSVGIIVYYLSTYLSIYVASCCMRYFVMY